MAQLISPLIVCGGSGTRLRPLSREGLPKQFLPLLAPRSTFQETLLRVADPALFERATVITHRAYHSLLVAQLAEIGVAAEILLEPERRGSGPAILAGTTWMAAKCGPDMPILALAADHVVRDVAAFHRACRAALPAAHAGSLVAFGIVPDHASTAYGYIEAGDKFAGDARNMRRFVEKPDAATAQRCVKEGFLWNSGNFLFQARSLCEEYERCDTGTTAVVTAAVRAAKDAGDAIHLDAEAFKRAASLSIDHAVMEKTLHGAVMQAAYDWLDIGSWPAVYRLASHARGDVAACAVRPIAVSQGEALVLADYPPQTEYWILVGGKGTVTMADGAVTLEAGAFLLVPAGSALRIDNRGREDLQIVAVPGAILQQ